MLHGKRVSSFGFQSLCLSTLDFYFAVFAYFAFQAFFQESLDAKWSDSNKNAMCDKCRMSHDIFVGH